MQNSGAEVPEEIIQRAKRLVPAHIKGEGLDPAVAAQMEQQAQTYEGTIGQLQQTLEQYEALISQYQADKLGQARETQAKYDLKQMDIMGKLMLERVKQEGDLEKLDEQTISNIIQDVFKESQKSVELSAGPVDISYTDPISAFTPMAKGPLVTGNQEGDLTQG